MVGSMTDHPTLLTTMRKWEKVYKALVRAGKQRSGGAGQVQMHNAPMYNEVLNNYERAFNQDHFNMTHGGSNRNGVRTYFFLHPAKGRNIATAYNKLNNLNKQLNKVATKIVAARTLQRRWRAAHSPVIAKRKVTSLAALKNLPPNMRRTIVSTAFPRSYPVYGPNTEMNALRKAVRPRKYPTY